MEIERKFLIEGIPSGLKVQSQYEILQGYMCISQQGSEVRLRKKAENYYLSYKSPGHLVREEVEMRIPETQFNHFWPTTKGRRIEKRRYVFYLDFHGHQKLEVDIFRGHLSGLVLGELEFQSESDALAFDPPKWFGLEVTHIEWLQNKELWKFPSLDFVLNRLSSAF